MNWRRAAAGVALLCLGTLLAIWLGRPGAEISPEAHVASPASASAFRAAFLPLVHHAAATAATLVELGETHERNLLLIHSRQDAMLAALAAADAWLAANPPAPTDAPAVAAYHEGAASIRAAMVEAQAGFLHLDFERVARATSTLAQGAAALSRAESLLAG